MLRSKEAPNQWNIKTMFPGEPDDEIAEKNAEYFNRISQEYTLLNKPLTCDYSHIGPIYMYQIAAKLRHISSKTTGPRRPTDYKEL